MATLTEERFKEDIAEHVMTIIREDGVYRHLRFAQPGTNCYSFELVTWPGFLAYTGDMGAFLFTRTHDMLEFFRRPEHCRYSIDMRYWGEKAVATNKTHRGDGIHEWSAAKFRAAVNRDRVQWIRDAHEYGALNKEKRRELWEAVEEDVMRQIESGQEFAEMAVYNFSWQAGANHPTYHFEDFFEADTQQYTHTFEWCCLALNWAVQVYDAAKAKEAKLRAIPDPVLLGRQAIDFVVPDGLTMADLDAEAKRRKMECACCGTTAGLWCDFGSGGPYRCSSNGCVVF